MVEILATFFFSRLRSRFFLSFFLAKKDRVFFLSFLNLTFFLGRKRVFLLLKSFINSHLRKQAKQKAMCKAENNLAENTLNGRNNLHEKGNLLSRSFEQNFFGMQIPFCLPPRRRQKYCAWQKTICMTEDTAWQKTICMTRHSAWQKHCA